MSTSGSDYTQPITINDAGTRAVVETNWHRVGGPRCQMLWDRTEDGGCVVTTCRADTPPIRLTAEQCSGLGFFLLPVRRV